MAKGEATPSIRVKRVKALYGAVKELALKKGFKDNDLVIVRSSVHHSVPDLDIKVVKGDPLEFIIDEAKKSQ